MLSGCTSEGLHERPRGSRCQLPPLTGQQALRVIPASGNEPSLVRETAAGSRQRTRSYGDLSGGHPAPSAMTWVLVLSEYCTPTVVLSTELLLSTRYSLRESTVVRTLSTLEYLVLVPGNVILVPGTVMTVLSSMPDCTEDC